tara:strand:+ start:284 stop:673 length:390 start_codon:yes stop_codon:yes gene_type:complete
MSNALAAHFLRVSETLILRREGESYDSTFLDWARDYLGYISHVTDYFFDKSTRPFPSSAQVGDWAYFKDNVFEGELELVDGMLYGLERTIASGSTQTEALESYFLRLGEVMLHKVLADERSSSCVSYPI